MSEFRQDNITKQWVLIAPKRSLRPEGFNTDPAMTVGLPEIDHSCVFCPGNEHLTPDTILALPRDRNWQIRVVPNKFETLSHTLANPLGRGKSDFYITRPGVGDHEVIIMRSHSKSLADQAEKDVELAIKSWQSRMTRLQDHVEVRYIHIIQNHGRLSGATVAHPHFQLFTLPFIPDHLQDELSGSASHFRHYDRCVYCETIDREIEDGSRIVVNGKNFLIYCPFASRGPFQVRIIPKKHSASFTGISVGEQKELAATLKHILGRIRHELNDPSYNFYIHTMPVCLPQPAYCDPASYHWHLEILPRINTWAGFELGTEIYINPVAPEEGAGVLRGDK